MNSQFISEVCRPVWFRVIVWVLVIVCVFVYTPQSSFGAFAAGRFPGGPVKKIDRECIPLSQGNYYALIGPPRGDGLMVGPRTKEYKHKGPLKPRNNMIGEVSQISLCRVKRGSTIQIKYAVPFLKYRGKSAA